MTVEIPREAELRILRKGKGMMRQMENEAPVVIPENEKRDKIVNQFPLLSDREQNVRFNPFSGILYVISYRENMREGERVVGRRHSAHKTIESAIRGTDDILTKNGKQEGSEVIKTRTLAKMSLKLIDDFRKGVITADNLDEVAERTIKELEGGGFGKVEKGIKQDLVAQIKQAAGPDKKGRFNPLISRVRLASALLKSTHELLFAKLVREKYSYLNLMLTLERNMERFYIEQGVSAIDGILTRGPKDKEFESMLYLLHGHFSRYLTPDAIKVNPYRKAALVANATMFGVRRAGREKSMLEYYLGKAQAEGLLELKPIQDILRDVDMNQEEKWEEVRRRLTLAKQEFASVMEEGETELNKPRKQKSNSSV